MATENFFTLPFESFDLDLIGLSSADVGSADFAERVSRFFADQFSRFGGKARVIVNDSDRVIEVRWTKGEKWSSPTDLVLDSLNRGKIRESIPLIWTLLQQQPDDTDNYYNLGVAYSEVGEYPKAIAMLEELLRRDPKHLHGLIALGVALTRTEKLVFGEESLRKALSFEPNNPWALRNLGGCLLKQERFAEAIDVLRKAIDASPKDVQSMIGLGQALEQVGKSDDADEIYERAIKQGGPQSMLDLAMERRTAIAQNIMRQRGGGFRPDVMMYISGALEKFNAMSASQIQSVGFEIAILGQSGLDINDPSKKYTIKSLPGEFTGLHLCSIMYAAFKEFAPAEDVGIDFSKEYALARGI